ncbi:OLC1v1001879C1 [Oldenlandia corymbosa var. corymbosa]|uniref:DNA helicase n=1 Tax=Oldenlandia corymbosa var. corymbosa TaxID=529605 RepID=A0AAV1D8M4_OLDCO|nr:OLC1v1001879C1 [Oldenlandia corymbosa var. corymbosa]
MAPRKKTNGAPKKASNSSSATQTNHNQRQSQPSKFGIQHFFDRHSQNQSQKPKKPVSNPDSNSPVSAAAAATLNPQIAAKVREVNDGSTCSNSSGAVPQRFGRGSGSRGTGKENQGLSCQKPRIDVVDERHKEGNEFSNASEITPTENRLSVVIDADEDPHEEVQEVSPELSKGKPPKRFKFSPGMLIKQSQDDGGDEVTWKISPINERLHSISKKFPEVVKVLNDSTRFNCLGFQQCSTEKTSPGAEGKLEKWLSSPPLKCAKNHLSCPDGFSLRKHNPGFIAPDLEKTENSNGRNSSGEICSQSPFQTPPSMSYNHEKPPDGVVVQGTSDQLVSRPHKKALIELLDQVEDVISVEESACEESVPFGSSGKCNKPNTVLMQSNMNTMASVESKGSNHYFLVLEVYEKHVDVIHPGSLHSFKMMRLLNEQSEEERVVQLWDEWFYSVVAPGDTVHVIGEFDSEGKCDISREKNFLIVHPDILVSGTRVASSFSCSRRTLLDERLKCNEYSTAALIGTLLHQIFQAGLISDSLSIGFLEEYSRTVVHKNLETLYACEVSEDETYKILVEAIPKLLKWISLFQDSQGSGSQTVDFGCHNGAKKVSVSEVLDIEEMAWAPRYGLKGMIDASMWIKVDNAENAMKVMPMEFKTGKGTSGQAATEHRAQVMLYTLLMSERYLKDVDQGLLYYLHTDQTLGVTVQRHDLVGLIIRRNEFASDLLRALTTQQLPPMQQSMNVCKGCRHLDVCNIYHKAYGGSRESSGLGDLFDSLVHHLTDEDILFLRKWHRLIDLEAKEMEAAKKEMWISHLLRNGDYSGCLYSLILDNTDDISQKNLSKGSRFIYRFVHQNFPSIGSEQQNSPSGINFGSTIRSGDYVVLSTEPGYLPVANGTVTDVGSFHVTVSLSKRLRIPRASPLVEKDLSLRTWRIDKDESMTSFAIMRFNLVQLFLQNEGSGRLRKMIINLEAPRFDGGCLLSQDPAISYVASEKTLNDDQRRAIMKILTAKDYALILGMPGTGKTSTMVHAVKALLLRGASILLTSYTNSAVDNLLMKLKSQGVDFIRIGRSEAVHEEIRGNCFAEMDIRSTKEVKQRLEQTRVFGVTCLGVNSPLLAHKRFDFCIIDEAGQTTLPVSLGPLMFASKFVLVGDHYQLPPLVQSAEAKENGLAVSLFCRLSEANPQAISALQSQYRMCAAIMELSNTLIYGNRLRCGSQEIENAQLIYTHSASAPEWINKALNPERPVIFINTDLLPAYEFIDNKMVNNPVEAFIVSEVIEALVSRGIEGEKIGIITPYNSQANLIRQSVSAAVEIHTIDRYQGRDKDCMLLSFVRSSENPGNYSSSLLGDWHRINVAVTRAKKKLIMVGSLHTVSRVPLLKLLIEKVEQQSGIMSVSQKDIHLKSALRKCSRTR